MNIGSRRNRDSSFTAASNSFRASFGMLFLQIDVTQGEMEFIVRRVNPDRLLIYLDRLGRLFLFQVGLAQVIIGLGGIVAEKGESAADLLKALIARS